MLWASWGPGREGINGRQPEPNPAGLTPAGALPARPWKGRVEMQRHKKATALRTCAVVLVLMTLMVVAAGASLAAERTVRVWFAGTPEPFMRAVNDVLKPAFETKHPGVRLQVDFIPWGELSPKLATAFAGGVAPDLFMHGQAATASFAAAGQVAPLDDWFASFSGAADFGATLNAGSYLRKRYMLPVFGSGQLLVYRADFFREAGLDPQAPPSTWDELMAAARKLARHEGARLIREGIDLPVRGISAQQVWSPFLWQNGGELLSSDGTAAAFNTPAGAEALRFYVSLATDAAIGTVDEAQPVGNLPPLAAGTVAMSFLPLEVINDIANYAPDVYPHIRVAAPLRRQTQAAWFSFAGMFVSRQSKEPELAREFLAFLAGEEPLEAIVSALGGLPPRQSLSRASFVTKNPAAVAFIQGMAHARFNPNHPQWVKTRDILVRYIEQAAFGRLAPDQALAQAEREVNRILR